MANTEPQIESIEHDAGRALVRLSVREDLSYFHGHFEGCALLPAVVQITWAIELGRAHLRVSGPFREMKGVKFMRVIRPGTQLALHLRCDEHREELKFEYRKGETVCSLGTALFGPPA